MTRILLVRRGCPYCRRMCEVVNKINLRLPIEKRIRIIDCYEYEEFGLENIGLMDKLAKGGFDSFPFLYLDGTTIEPAPTNEQMEILLTTFLNKDLLYVRNRK